MARNATRTILRQALWRRGRGSARALLLMGAHPGMTLGTVARARTPFRSSFTATEAIPQFRAAASSASSIAFRAAGAQVVSTSAGASNHPGARDWHRPCRILET
jgi:hypothetical protein